MLNLSDTTGFISVQLANITESSEIRVFKNDTTPINGGSMFSDIKGFRQDTKAKELIGKSISAYQIDSLVRQTVDKYSELFKGFNFIGGEKQVNYIKNRLNYISLQSGEHWETLLTRIITEYFKTGNAFLIKVRGNVQAANRPLYRDRPFAISRLILISPDRLDPVKDDKGAFIGWKIPSTSNENRPVLLNPGSKALSQAKSMIKMYNLPEEKKDTMLPGADLIHLAYKKPPDCNWGFGMTLSALEDVSLLRTMEQTTAIMVRKYSNPIIHHRILRPSSPLSPLRQEINDAYALHRRMPLDGVIITGGNSEIKAIGSESQAMRIAEYLKIFVARALAGLGTSPFLMGMESGTQGTAEAAVELMMMKARFCQKEISREIKMFLLNELLWEGGFDPYNNPLDEVELIFEDIDEDRKIKLETHAADMFQKNMWGHKEARTKIGCTDCEDSDLYLNKIDIPKSEAENKLKTDLEVTKAKVKPKPVKSVKSSASFETLISNIAPTTDTEIPKFLDLLISKFSLSPEKSMEMSLPIHNLLNDKEALVEYVIQNINEENN